MPSPQIGPRRIAWITPDYPPDRGGVSDHSAEMVGALRADGHEVMVCTRPQSIGFRHLNAELRSFRPDLVVVAYVPLGYAPRTGGIAPVFALWCAGLRRRLGCRTGLLAHEVSLPAAYLWKKRELKLAALGAAQILQFMQLARCFDAVLFSNEGTRLEWIERLPKSANRFNTLRICSNIPHRPSSDAVADLSQAGYSVPGQTILFFGTGHQSVLFDYVEAAFHEISKLSDEAVLVIIGMDRQKLLRLYPSLANLGERVRALGYVPAPEVSLWLQVAKLTLAPLVEGVSARRGTVMAALQHGQAVVTTRSYQTRNDVAWDEICILSARNRDQFAATAVNAFRDPDLLARLGRAARAEYEAHASATVTAREVLRCETVAF